MPKQTGRWCRRKSRRLHRKGMVSLGKGCHWISTRSRRYPYIDPTIPRSAEAVMALSVTEHKED